MADEVANAVKDETVAEPVTTDSAPVENQAADGANAQVADANDEDFFADVDAEVAKTETDGEAEEAQIKEPAAEETKVEAQPRGEDGKFIKTEQPEEKPLAPKSENRFQKLANDNKAKDELIRQQAEQLERLKLQESQIATEQELLNEINPETGDYYTPQEVERLAFAQSREQQAQSVSQQRYQLEVQQSQQVLANETEQILTEFPIFNDKSPEYNPVLTAQADELLKQSLVFDQNGTLIGSNLSPYKLYKSLADATKANAPVYQAQAQKSVERMTANADVGSGATQATKTKVDPMMDAFDEEASRR